MGKPRQTLVELKKLRKELKQHMKAIKAEMLDIGEGKPSKYTTKELKAVKDNLKIRLRGVHAAIRRQGMGKLQGVQIARPK